MTTISRLHSLLPFKGKTCLISQPCKFEHKPKWCLVLIYWKCIYWINSMSVLRKTLQSSCNFLLSQRVIREYYRESNIPLFIWSTPSEVGPLTVQSVSINMHVFLVYFYAVFIPSVVILDHPSCSTVILDPPSCSTPEQSSQRRDLY